MKIIALFTLLFAINQIQAEDVAPGSFSITRIHYGGGGDWYADPSSLYNLLNYVESKLKINVVKQEDVVKVGDENFYKYLESGYGIL